MYIRPRPRPRGLRTVDHEDTAAVLDEALEPRSRDVGWTDIIEDDHACMRQHVVAEGINGATGQRKARRLTYRQRAREIKRRRARGAADKRDIHRPRRGEDEVERVVRRQA